MSDLSLDIVRIARNHGWETKVESSWGWWDRSFTRGTHIIYVRVRGNKITGLSIHDGSGVILIPKQAKRQQLIAAITEAIAIKPAHHDVSTPGSSLKFCACGQGYSGHAAAERLQDHMVNPDPMSTGALLIQAMR